MGTLKHTPGPWKYYGGYILGADKYPIAGMTFTSKVDSANKKLILSAPDLLHALMRARDELSRHIVFVERHDLIEQINNAIIKATK